MDLKRLIGVNASREFLDALGHSTERPGEAVQRPLPPTRLRTLIERLGNWPVAEVSGKVHARNAAAQDASEATLSTGSQPAVMPAAAAPDEPNPSF